MLNRDIIRDNPEKKWNWDGISSNPNITWDIIIRDNPDKPWNWYEISRNPNITWDIIQNNPEKLWDFYYISDNTFTKEKEEFIRQKFREHFMGKGFGYDKTSLFRELMERVWSPENLEKFDYRMLET